MLYEQGSGLPEWVPVAEWKGWVEMRKLKKWPLTARSVQMAINTLAVLRQEGNDPGMVLDQSTFNCWRGLFPVYSPKPKEQLKDVPFDENLAQQIRNRIERAKKLGVDVDSVH